MAPTPQPDSRLVLVNAVYFKATWEDQFEDRWTKDAPFKVSEDKSVTAKLMQKNHHWDYADDGSCQLVALPYESVDDRKIPFMAKPFHLEQHWLVVAPRKVLHVRFDPLVNGRKLHTRW